MQVGFTPEFARRLRQELGLDDKKEHNPHGGGNTYQLERALEQDVLMTSVCWANSFYQHDHDYVDEWGVGWTNCEYNTPYGKGHYTDMITHPLADNNAICRYTPPDPNRPELYRDSEWMMNEYSREYFIIGVTVTTILETAIALRGGEQLLIDLATDHELVDAILDIPYNYHLAAAKKLVALGVDMIWTGDDVGAQNGMIISPAMWRRFFKPRMAMFFNALKGINPNVKIAYHSDGMIYPIIPDLIEIGLDVLNPIQPACLDPERIKREYGDKLCFWGSIDEQHTLPFGTTDDVRKEVLTRLDTIGKDGGLIIGPTHFIQLDTPMQNFHAMVETITGTPYAKDS